MYALRLGYAASVSKASSSSAISYTELLYSPPLSGSSRATSPRSADMAFMRSYQVCIFQNAEISHSERYPRLRRPYNPCCSHAYVTNQQPSRQSLLIRISISIRFALTLLVSVIVISARLVITLLIHRPAWSSFAPRFIRIRGRLASERGHLACDGICTQSISIRSNTRK